MCEWGYESGRGRAALERMNWVHSHYKIPNDDYLYVLSTFIYEPIGWIDRFGWRPTCTTEKLGYYYFWREVGNRMGITGIPPSFEAFEAWSRSYEREQCRFANTNQRIGAATRELFASWFPGLVRPLVRYGIYAMLDNRMLASFGFPTPWPMTRALLGRALKARGRVVRWLPPRRTPHFFTDNPNRTYRDGYRIEELGPPPLVAIEKARGKPTSPDDTA